jgi:uncharacterized protein YlaI|tara:strand:+ start:418 stop:573 length:156 start_codon:yes stop_codon:yes gene_type:complete
MMVECMACDGRYWLEEKEITTQIVINSMIIGYFCNSCSSEIEGSFTTEVIT